MDDQEDKRAERGRSTRRQMLKAGLEAFARYGPDGISTRELAKIAGVNSAAIAYHFGSKEGYYLAVVRYLVEERAGPLISLLKLFEELQKKEKDGARELFEMFIYHLVWAVLTNSDARLIASISSREHLHPTEAYEIIFNVLSRLHNLIGCLIKSSLKKDLDDQEVSIMAHAILGQIFLFRIGARTLLRVLSKNNFDEELIEKVARVVSRMAAGAISED